MLNLDARLNDKTDAIYLNRISTRVTAYLFNKYYVYIFDILDN